MSDQQDDDSILFLLDFGFAREDIIEALKASDCDPDKAYELLKNKKLPPKLPLTISSNMNQLKQLIQEQPDRLPEIFQLLIQQNDHFKDLLLNSPEMFLHQIGLNPQIFDLSFVSGLKETYLPRNSDPFSQYQDLIKDYTSEQFAALKNLLTISQNGVDIVIQVFEACDRNEESAMELLAVI